MIRCRWFILIGLATCLVTCFAQSQDRYPFSEPEHAQRFSSITQQVRCLVCQNQSIADSNAPLANDLRDKVYQLIQSGQSDAEVKQFLVSRYGDYVLFKPPVSSITWLLWALPFLLIFIAAGVLRSVYIGQNREQKA